MWKTWNYTRSEHEFLSIGISRFPQPTNEPTDHLGIVWPLSTVDRDLYTITVTANPQVVHIVVH